MIKNTRMLLFKCVVVESVLSETDTPGVFPACYCPRRPGTGVYCISSQPPPPHPPPRLPRAQLDSTHLAEGFTLSQRCRVSAEDCPAATGEF